jgi:phosphatidylglycerol:prolipoprotein diacylglycerol transferase
MWWAYLLGWRYARRLAANNSLWPGGRSPITPLDMDDFLVWATIGIVAGGRIGYILFYDFAAVAANPFRAFEIWNGGMSFHGGVLGTLAGNGAVCPQPQHPRLQPVRCGLRGGADRHFFGRIANFINSELWGRLTDAPWAFVFPTGGPFPRHPTQLYEAALEGLVLLAVLAALVYRRDALKSPGLIAGIFLIGYALARIAGRVLP